MLGKVLNLFGKGKYKEIQLDEEATELQSHIGRLKADNIYTYFYTSYTLNITSELALPELALSDGEYSGNPDVSITLGKVNCSALEDGTQIGPFLWVNPVSLWLQVPHVAQFLVQSGSEIIIEPEPGVDEESIRVFLLGSAFGALLFQRGYLVLHGNAIRIGNQCMVCVGHSGTGKSTLAAGFMQRGYQILADDVVPVDTQCRVLPGFPRIKLWQDVAEKLAIKTDGLRRIRSNLHKFSFPVSYESGTEALPIRWVYILGSDHIEEVRIKPIQGMKRFLPLRNNTYRMRYMEGMALKAEHLKLCGQLAGRIRLANIDRPKAGFTLDQMIDTILADIEENP